MSSAFAPPPPLSTLRHTRKSPKKRVQRMSLGPNTNKTSLANLHELTERIADLLQVGSLETNSLHCPKDAPLGYLEASMHVVVVFAKGLIRDQISVEYAKRVVTLVKQLASGALTPDIVCFTGGRGGGRIGNVSDAAVGYAFFRNVCEEAGVDVSGMDFVLDEKSVNAKEKMANVIEMLRRRAGSDAVAKCHFTLVSSDYHLIRIQEVHRLCPRQSMLFPLEVSSATWNCIFAAYPFCVSRDPATAFLGRAVVLANDLGIVLVNLNGALDDRQFVSKENLHRLSETFAKMREMYRVIDARTSVTGGFRTDMRAHAETLELGIHDIREVHTLLSPLMEGGGSVERRDLELARNLLRETIVRIRSSMDPDRILRVHDRMAIMEDMIKFVAQERLKPRDRGGEDGGGRGGKEETGPRLGDLVAEESVESRRRATTMGGGRTSEVKWDVGPLFEGNGKRIARDGPNLVITDSGMTPRNSTRSLKTSRRRTVSQSDSLAGRLAMFGAEGRKDVGGRAKTKKTSKKRKTTGARKVASGGGGADGM